MVEVGSRHCLFAGDAIWHDGKDWKAFPTKPGRPKMIDSLRQLADVDFDVLLANTKISNPHCFIELNERSRRVLIESIIARL